jgi:FkbM family methyltransferase
MPPLMRGLLVNLLGRGTAWRIGRALYMESRNETHNAIASNGEAVLARMALEAYRRSRPTRPFTAFDVGANLGEWTAVVADAAESSDWQVEVFEPVEGSFERLSQRFADQPRVHCHRLAISNRVGEAEMFIVGDTSGTNSLTQTGTGEDTTRITVPLTTLEAHMASIGAHEVDIVKIDAEGHDIEILRGLGSLLSHGALGIVQFEYNWRWLPNRGSLWEVFELVKGTRYSVARVEPTGPTVFESWNAELDRFFEANYALIRDDVAASLGARRTRWSNANLPVSA